MFDSTFTTHDLLTAIREAPSFTKQEIHKAVVSRAREKDNSYEGILDGISQNQDLSAEYKSILEQMGFSFIKYSPSAAQNRAATTILTFKTDFEMSPPVASSSSPKPTGLLLLPDEAKCVLKKIGFENIFLKVVLTTDMHGAFQHCFPKSNTAQYLTQFLRKPGKEKTPTLLGCGFGYGKESLPCLVLNISDDTFEARHLNYLRLRIIHEAIHFYLKYTVMLEIQELQSLNLLCACGPMIQKVAIHLINESLAHIDTARFCRDAYFEIYSPQHLHLGNTIKQQRGMISKLRPEHAEAVLFIWNFPVACAYIRCGKVEDGLKIINQFPGLLKTLAQELFPAVSACYTDEISDNVIYHLVKAFDKAEVVRLFYQLESTDRISSFLNSRSGAF